MKAYEILMIMLIFNVVIWLFSNVGLVTNLEGINPEGGGGISLFDIGFLSFLALMAGAAGISMILGSDKSLHTILYTTFGIAIWGTYLKTLTVFQSLTKMLPYNIGILSVFTFLVVIVFIIGFAQMATGSWKQYA